MRIPGEIEKSAPAISRAGELGRGGLFMGPIKKNSRIERNSRLARYEKGALSERAKSSKGNGERVVERREQNKIGEVDIGGGTRSQSIQPWHKNIRKDGMV